MDDKHKQELLDQFDDATFALMMDEYAQQEGARLLQEFNEAVSAGEVPEIPEHLDSRCRRTIRREFAGQRLKARAQRLVKAACKAAVVAMAVFSVAAAAILSVEALRVPVLSFLVGHFGEYSSIELTTQPRQEECLSGLLPADYDLVYCEEHDGLVSTMYENSAADYIIFDMSPATGEYWFDSEGGEWEYVTIGGFEAIFLREDRLQMIWIDESAQIVYNFTASGLPESEFLEICENLAQCVPPQK